MLQFPPHIMAASFRSVSNDATHKSVDFQVAIGSATNHARRRSPEEGRQEFARLPTGERLIPGSLCRAAQDSAACTYIKQSTGSKSRPRDLQTEHIRPTGLTI